MGKEAEDGGQLEIKDVEVLDGENGQTENMGDENKSITGQYGESGYEEKTEGDDDDVIVSIGDDEPPREDTARAPEWVRELRRSAREKDRRIKELEHALSATSAESRPAELGKKPTLEECDYDAEKFEAELAAWFVRKRDADQQVEQQRQAEKAQHEAWQARLDSYGKAKDGLKVADFEDAELAVQDLLDLTQQGIIVQGADNPALLVYAIGKNQAKAKELAGIKDPVKFAFAVAKLEKELKVTTRKPATQPERTIQGTGRVSGTVDSELERLRAKAEKTGNYTDVIKYRQQQRNKAK
jgi:hypothetical protein